MNAIVDKPVTAPCVVAYAPHHEAQVIALAREMHAESVFHRRFKFDEAKVKQQLALASRLDSYYFKVCVRGDDVLGGFFGSVSATFFSDELVAKDLAWFVSKTRRGSVAALLLVTDFEAWARTNGAKQFVLGQSTGVHIDTTLALYEHLGYEVVGMNTVKRAG